MWASRSFSLGDIDRLGSATDVVAKTVVQVTSCTQVDSQAENLRQLPLDGNEGESRNVFGLELDEQIEIAVLALLASEPRSEQREPANVMFAAVFNDGGAVEVNRAHVQASVLNLASRLATLCSMSTVVMLVA